MGEKYDYDVAVIGSGPAGYVAGIRAAQYGAGVCVIEKGPLGGVCTNAGCIPTKVLWHTAGVALRLDKADELGLEVGDVSVNWPRLAERREGILDTLRNGIQALLKGNGVELIRGQASFAGAHTLNISDGGGGAEQVTADKIIAATGSRPVELPHAPFDHEVIIDSTDAVTADELPASVVIIGGGYIGLEFASIYTACGAEVTIVEALDRLLPGMDEDCAQEVTRFLKHQGVAIHTGVTLDGVEHGNGSVTGKLSDGTEVAGEKMLVCVGRRADASTLELEAVGVETEESGAMAVNEHMQTSQPHVYAVGDVNGRLMLAHVGSQEGLVAAAHATGTITARMDYRVAPACVFVHPEVAVVGLGEEEAREEVGEIIVKKFPFRALGKAHIMDETDGLVKMVCDAATGQVLGVHMAGPEASTLLGEATLAVQLECTAEEMAETIHAHPTLAEALKEVAEGVIGMPINWRG